MTNLTNQNRRALRLLDEWRAAPRGYPLQLRVIYADKYGNYYAEPGTDGTLARNRLARYELAERGETVSDRAEIFEAISREREYQDNKWGTPEQNPHDVPGWLLIMSEELNEAHRAWAKNPGDEHALRELLQVVAVGVACLEQHGVVERWENQNRSAIQ